MEKKNDQFNYFLNKTIIFSSKEYYRKQMTIDNKEPIIVDNEDYSAFLQNYINTNMPISDFERVESSLKLNRKLDCLSDIEQAVIFLLFEDELSEDEAAKILNIWKNSVNRIKLRSIKKLKKYLKGDFENGK